MTGKVVDRKKRAKTYRLKSDRSYAGAQLLLNAHEYRCALNRFWYSVMQIITAATYEDMNDEPSNDKPNWSHERQSIMFRNFARKHNVWEENKSLAAEIDMMRERRYDADYVSPDELYSNHDGALRSFQTASQVRDIVFKLIGTRWDHHQQNVPANNKISTLDNKNTKHSSN